MKRRHLTAVSVSALGLITHCVALASEGQGGPPQLGCSSPPEWGEGRQSAEQHLKSGYTKSIAAVGDPQLLAAVQEYWRARSAGDLSKLLELEISQSESHLDVEVESLSKMLAVDRSNKLSNPIPHSVWLDASNAAHFRVYTTVVIKIGDRCFEDGVMTEWVRLDGDWFTLPESHFLTSGAKHGRPNRGYTLK